MSLDPKITDTLLYGEPHYGDGLSMEQRLSTATMWDDDWLVIADQFGRFGGREIKHVAVQFFRRPKRQRYLAPPQVSGSRVIQPARAKELEDA